LTEGNYQDNLERTYTSLTDSELIERLAGIIHIMSGRTRSYDQLEETKEIPDNRPTDKDMAWHCYCCGHSWHSYDKTNPEPPEKCTACGRSDWKQPRNLCKHDKNCNRCLKKKAAIIALAEKVKTT
jgi:rubrerythrin